MKKNKTYIENIFDSISKIETFVNGLSEEDFKSNQMAQSAVILHLALIGENANKISLDIKSKIDLPWKEIIAFRNIAIHEYLNLEINVVWNTIIIDLPLLKEGLKKIPENEMQ